MITVEIRRKENQIVEIEVKGHADYDRYGKDIVCAGTSAVMFGGLNAIAHFFADDLSRFQVRMNDGVTWLRINDLEEKRVQTVLETLVIQFKTIEETYSKYIHVKEQEVR